MIIVDNVIQDRPVLEKFADRDLWVQFDDDTTLDKSRKIVSTNLDSGSELKDIWEFLVFALYDNPFLDLHGYGATEIEYWGNVLREKAELEWHQDKREDIYQETGETILPKQGVIWYGYPHKVWGGYLEVKHKYEYWEDIERVEPVYNRAVVFDPSDWHRVDRILGGERYGFQLNLW